MAETEEPESHIKHQQQHHHRGLGCLSATGTAAAAAVAQWKGEAKKEIKLWKGNAGSEDGGIRQSGWIWEQLSTPTGEQQGPHSLCRKKLDAAEENVEPGSSRVSQYCRPAALWSSEALIEPTQTPEFRANKFCETNLCVWQHSSQLLYIKNPFLLLYKSLPLFNILYNVNRYLY